MLRWSALPTAEGGGTLIWHPEHGFGAVPRVVTLYSVEPFATENVCARAGVIAISKAAADRHKRRRYNAEKPRPAYFAHDDSAPQSLGNQIAPVVVMMFLLCFSARLIPPLQRGGDGLSLDYSIQPHTSTYYR